MREDIKTAANENHVSISKRQMRIIEAVEPSLNDDETVIYINFTSVESCVIGTRKRYTYAGALVLFTNKRIIIQEKIAFGAGLERIALKDILSVSSQGNGISAGHVIFTTNTKSYDMIVSYDRAVQEQIQKLLEGLVSNVSSCNTIPEDGNDILSQIEKMSKLWKAGILTDEEFTTKKAELLSRL